MCWKQERPTSVRERGLEVNEDRNIADVLAEVAEQAEQTRDAFTKMYRSERLPSDPSQVYSIRIPVSRLDKIRRLAIRYKMPPTSMLRQWILERLDLEEQSGGGSVGEASSSGEQGQIVYLYPHHGSTSAVMEAHAIERELRTGEGRARMAGV
jgi:hypothetical protein